jgi:hypothetical protein
MLAVRCRSPGDGRGHAVQKLTPAQEITDAMQAREAEHR